MSIVATTAWAPEGASGRVGDTVTRMQCCRRSAPQAAMRGARWDRCGKFTSGVKRHRASVRYDRARVVVAGGGRRTSANAEGGPSGDVSYALRTSLDGLVSAAVSMRGVNGLGRRNVRAHSAAVVDAASDGGEVSDPPKKKSGGNLFKRTTSALAMGAIGAVVIFAGGWPWALAMAVFNGAACVEFFTMVCEMNKELPYPPPKWCIQLCTLACASLPILLHATGGKMTSIILATVFSFTAICAALIWNEESHFNEFTSSLFGLIYCGFLPTFWVKLRGMSGVPLDAPGSLLHLWPAWLGGPGIWSLGLVATITIVLSVVSSDVGAYAAGKTFGKNKLISVSPNKTVEGAIGGLLATVGMCAFLFRVMGWPGTVTQGCFLGVTVFFTSVFGDLLESVIKRNAKMKDSGNLIPGHGGLLDRFDSYMFTGSVTYFFVIAVLGGFRSIFTAGYY